MGEGGALVTNDNQLKRLITSFRDWGRHCWCETGCDNTCGKRFGWQLGTLPIGYDHKFIYSHIGYNLKITDMQAAIGVAQLKKLAEFTKIRKRNWEFLYKGLKKYEDYFILPKPTNNSDPSWFGFSLTVKENAPFSRNEIVNYLEKNNIATRLLFSGSIIHHPSFEGVKFRIYGKLSNTDFAMNNTFWIGVYPGITDNMICYVLENFDKFIELYGGENKKL
jgi:CDP-6-deoxy-D-xylo-4-hexulose-3-dehydrase